MVKDLRAASAAYKTIAQANGLSPKTVSWATSAARALDAFLRAYPNNPAALKAMRAQAKCRKAM